ncbi:hypothetical protein ACED51_14265 [Photobacterium swingsii]|uniref:hypothetical protein n=1 Tax=Photobacterium swingsii TaxID=680026 RepID=UPI00352F72DB
MNNKSTSKPMASKASDVLRSPHATNIQRSLAASALSQSSTSKQTSSQMETVASKVLTSSKYNATTKSLAATVLSQSNKKR